jgi:hypothetical protein
MELYLGSTQFTSTSFPSTIWDSYAGLSFVGQNFIEIGTAEYTGNPAKTPPVRWGDYNTMNYDPLAKPPGGDGSWWSVEEISQGGSDQSTNWIAMADPTPPPHFVSWNYAEQECNFSPGQTCTAKFPTPAGLQNGDIVVVFADMGGNFPTPPTPPPDKTWVELPIANLSNATSMVIGACNVGDLITAYAYAHVYGSSTETGTYDFKHVMFDSCNGQFRSEIEGFLAGYRGASSNLSSYVLYGYPETFLPSNELFIGPAPANSPSEGVLLNVFYGGNYESPESEENVTTFYPPTGSGPPLTSETPYSGVGPYFLADLGIPGPNTPMGQYEFYSSVTAELLWGWQLFMGQQ